MIRFRPSLFPSRLASCLILAGVLFGGSFPSAAQDAPVERSFHHSQAEVEKALQTLRTTASGRLPFLEGFVGSLDQPLDRFERAYYQCSFQVAPQVGGETLVRVIAKITAWYSSVNPSEAGYRALPSNGRLENDFLDRLAEALDGKSSAPAAPPVPAPAPATKPNLKLDLPGSNVRVYGSGAAPSGEARSSAPSSSVIQPESEDLRKQREASEKRRQQLNAELQSLLEIQRAQVHPQNLAIVRQAGVPVLAKPVEGSRVLFAAELHDEFEILDLEPKWVHVEISGPSRGWIRRSQLELPESYSASSGAAVSPLAPQDQGKDREPSGYRVLRQETGPFPGKWEALQGKTVKIIWVQPQPAPGRMDSPLARRRFAKSLFWKALDDSPAAAALAGVVIILDAPDGGEAAATLAMLQDWKSATLSDDVFWRHCYLDPPEAFREPAQP